MIDTGLYLPLRMYEPQEGDPELWNNRKECEGFSLEELIWYEQGKLPPFQIRGSLQTGVTSAPIPANVNKNFTVLELCSGEIDTITLSLRYEFVPLVGNPTSGHYYWTFLGGSVDIGSGTFLISSTDPGCYSEMFFLGDVSEMVHLKYRDTGLRDDIYWTDDFYAECYINSVIDKPTYPVMEEVSEDQEGDQHRIFQRWEKRHTVRFFGVESMADAMSLLRLMDEVYINGVRVFDVLCDPQWDDESQCIAEMPLSFTHKKLIKSF